MKTAIEAVMTGGPKPFGPNGEKSAIRKTQVTGPTMLSSAGVEGDEHTDPNHGGAEKALLHYALEGYELWARRFPGFALGAGGFGENIVTRGMTEENVCVGDRYRVGDAVVVEVTQPRQPCWKLSYNALDPATGEFPDVAAAMQEEAAPGWYYRVLKPGPIERGMPMELTERPSPEWTLARLIRGFYGTPLDDSFLREAITVDRLGTEWRTAMERRIERGAVERWEGRLYGPLKA